MNAFIHTGICCVSIYVLFHSLPSLIFFTGISFIYGQWGSTCVNCVMYVLNPWLGVHMSWHTPIFDALPPGHNAYGQEGQHIDGCYGQYECQFGVGQAVGNLVHCQFFLEMGLGLAMAIASNVGVVCIQNPPDHMWVSYRSCFQLDGNVRS